MHILTYFYELEYASITMNRIDRLSAILIQLQSKSCITAAEIADRFNISLRTVYRDIRALEEGGVPIASEAGKGYSLCSGYNLPPIMFTQDEASAFILAEKLMSKMSDIKIQEAFSTALFKLKSVLRSNEKDYLESLDQKISVYNINNTNNHDTDLFLNDIQHALVNKKLLEIEYEANYNGKISSRVIEPMCLCNYWQTWHLISYCRLRNSYRDFRLDRICSLKVLDEHYGDENLINIEDYFNTLSPQNDLKKITLQIDKSIYTQVSLAKYFYGLLNEQFDGNNYTMDFAYGNLIYFAKWIISFGTEVKVISPPELQEEIILLVKELYSYHE